MDIKRTSIPVAVIGMGCWYPGASSPGELWANILSRRRQFRRIPKCRLSLEDYHSLEETAYLLRSSKNAARLVQSIEEIEGGKAKERQLLE